MGLNHEEKFKLAIDKHMNVLSPVDAAVVTILLIDTMNAVTSSPLSGEGKIAFASIMQEYYSTAIPLLKDIKP